MQNNRTENLQDGDISGIQMSFRMPGAIASTPGLKKLHETKVTIIRKKGASTQDTHGNQPASYLGKTFVNQNDK